MSPTGYTAALHKGEQPFAEFVMECARAFGALASLRDSMDTPIPDEFKPSPYHAEGLVKAKERVNEVWGWSDAEAEQKAAETYDLAKQAYDETVEEITARADRYRRMTAEVLAWEPPTLEHDELRAFMLQQLEESRKFDCSTKYLTPPERLDGHTFRERALEQARKDVAYHEEKLNEERERAAGNTAWVRALRESLATTTGGSS